MLFVSLPQAGNLTFGFLSDLLADSVGALIEASVASLNEPEGDVDRGEVQHRNRKLYEQKFENLRPFHIAAPGPGVREQWLRLSRQWLYPLASASKHEFRRAQCRTCAVPFRMLR